MLLLAAVPLLVPKLSARLSALWPVPRANPERLNRPIIWMAALTCALPLLLLATVRVQDSQRSVVNDAQHTLVPVSSAFHPSGTISSGVANLSWQAPYRGSVGTFYVVLRAPHKFPDPSNPEKRIVKRGVSCREQKSGASKDCHLYMRRLGATRAVTATDRPPAKGVWDYRIGLAANWLDDPTRGDVILVSPAVTIDLR